ncbi:MAG: PepSY-associated TM helix domain-containing protein [bacterium]
MSHWNTNTSVTVNHLKESENQIKLFLEGGKGHYHKSSGEVYYEIYKKRPVITSLNQLHNNQIKGWIYIADIYAFLLTFLAISGLVMVKGKNGFFKRGVWLVALGIFVVILFAFVN